MLGLSFGTSIVVGICALAIIHAKKTPGRQWIDFVGGGFVFTVTTWAALKVPFLKDWLGQILDLMIAPPIPQPDNPWVTLILAAIPWLALGAIGWWVLNTIFGIRPSFSMKGGGGGGGRGLPTGGGRG